MALSLAPVVGGILLMAINVGETGRMVLLVQVIFTLYVWFLTNLPRPIDLISTMCYALVLSSPLLIAHTGLAPIAVAFLMLCAVLRVNFDSLDAMFLQIRRDFDKAFTAVDLE